MKSNDMNLEQTIEMLKSQVETQQRYIDDLELRLTNLTVDLYGHLVKRVGSEAWKADISTGSPAQSAMDS